MHMKLPSIRILCSPTQKEDSLHSEALTSNKVCIAVVHKVVGHDNPPSWETLASAF